MKIRSYVVFVHNTSKRELFHPLSVSGQYMGGLGRVCHDLLCQTSLVEWSARPLPLIRVACRLEAKTINLVNQGLGRPSGLFLPLPPSA